MTRSISLRFSTASWTTSFTALCLITAVAIWQLLQALPFETLSSPGDLLGMVLGIGLATMLAVHGSTAEGRLRTNYLLLATYGFGLAVGDYLLDSPRFDLVDPFVASLWIALGVCLATTRVVGPLSRAARLCIAIGLVIEILELLRSLAVATMYGDSQPAVLQWFESESDLLLRTAYVIGVIEIWYAQALPLPAPSIAGSGNWFNDAFSYFRTSPLVMPLLNGRMQYGYAKFKAQHPRASFGEYYANRVSGLLDAGHGHPTLGQRSYGIKLPFSRRPKRADDFLQKGRLHIELAMRAGLQPHHVLVDYGCGSLRVGQHFIQYLKAGNYWGLDVVDRFFRDGFELLAPEAKDKAPNLRVISPETLREAANAYPDFVVCFAVLTHVPLDELEVTIDRIMGLAGDKTVLVLSFYEAETYMLRGVANFTHTASSIEDLVLARRPGAVLRYHRKRRRNKRVAEWHTHLEIHPAPERE